ncbi:hypothetical protein [Dendronalium sp. ChiSLP03b]|uniref:hypothetical protein n=1 Tax=Dendronalium sp. ChiSLP03b TaxID=3075381 RepID=UPI002AD23CAF|nr:hypothetical protein [Dendronalium sp. ChiSLP03b]MDZ8209328.1 hypothetical protein [Dendronalium sp. ChiSLP03b]
MINTSNSSTTGHIRIGSSSLVDFAFWVLLQDGLHVPLFDKHTGGDQILQHYGMNAQSWHNWLKLILVRHDNRLIWHVPDINTASEKNVQSFQEILDINNQINNVVCNESWHDSQKQLYLQELTEQEQGYQSALADYPGLDFNFIIASNPPQLWQDEKGIREIITQLWHEYQPLKYSNQFLSEILITPKSWQVELTPPTNKYREIYLVDYPYEVEMFVSPIFCIVSIPNRPIEQVQLESRIFNIIQSSE